MSLSSLPDELLLQIASHLDFYGLIALQQVCSRLHDITKSSAALRYAIELRVAGMIDNPASRLVPGERLRVLQEKEKAWRTLDLSDRRSLALTHRPSGIYDLTGGTLLLGERRGDEGHSRTDAVHTIHLHSAFSEEQGRRRGSLWSTIDVGKQVIDVGLAIQEHDLIAIVTYSYISDSQLLASIDIHLLKHSTGQPHPAAAKPVLHFEDIQYLAGHCSIMLEISGDTLCFLMNNYFPFGNVDPVTLVAYNWKTGQPVVMQKRSYSDPTMFNSFILLSPDTVVLPIIPTNALEICQFSEELAAASRPTSAGEGDEAVTDLKVPELKSTCLLELPPLDPGVLVLRMTCRCEPNPRGPPSSATHFDKAVPYYSDPETAIMILHLHFRQPTGNTRVYTMIVHRSSLLKAMQATIDRRRNTAAAYDLIFRELLDENATAGDEDNAEMVDGDGDGDEEVLYVPASFDHDGPSQRQRQSPWLAGSSFQPDLEETEGLIKVPWAEWGPPVTRWFRDELPGTRWITTTCGQRLVRVGADGLLRVYDFNQLGIRRYLEERSLEGRPVGSLPGEVILYEKYRAPDTKLAFTRWGAEVEEDEEDQDHSDDGGVGGDDDDEAFESRPVWMMPRAPGRQVKVVLGTTTIGDRYSWETELESSLPYIETCVPAPDDYESALLDEDIIVGLKMDSEGRHIQEIVLHRIGGPIA